MTEDACAIKCSHLIFFTSESETVYKCVMGKTPPPPTLSFLTSPCPRHLPLFLHLLFLCLSPPTPSSLSGGALNSVPDRPAHRGAQLWNGVCAVLSGALPPRQSTQRTATTEPPEPPGDRPLQSGLSRKAVIDPSPGARAHRERGDRESGERGKRECVRGLKGAVKGGLGDSAAANTEQTKESHKQTINKLQIMDTSK